MITLNPEKGRASSEVLPLSRPSCSRPLGLEPVWAVSAKVLPLATESCRGPKGCGKDIDLHVSGV